jgi:omega-hydroxy-beta-dihydromenaquinone-9 sulfotransferase
VLSRPKRSQAIHHSDRKTVARRPSSAADLLSLCLASADAFVGQLGEVLSRWGSISKQIVWPHNYPGAKTYAFRLFVSLLMAPVFLVWQVVQWAGLLLDEVFFADYRNIKLESPVFILGVPRSGTTHLHHLLADDPRFTTVALWEALFASSITLRRLANVIDRVDRVFSSPIRRTVTYLDRRVSMRLGKIHKTGMQMPEEDFLLLMTSLDCFLLVLVYPDCPWLWALARGDESHNRAQVSRMMKRYKSLLQRHVYYHGNQLRLLSKNASFAGLCQTLASEFPDSIIIVCDRDAVLAGRSQLRSIAAVRKAAAIDRICPEFEDQLLGVLQYYYSNLQCLERHIDSHRFVRVPLWRLSRHPRMVLDSIYKCLNLGLPEEIELRLNELEASPPIEPMTDTADAADSAAFFRFSTWRHAPENRL